MASNANQPKPDTAPQPAVAPDNDQQTPTVEGVVAPAPTVDERTALSTGAPAPDAEVVAARLNRLAQPKSEVTRELGGKYIVLHDAVDTWRLGDEVDFDHLDAKQIKRLIGLGAIAERKKLSFEHQAHLRNRGIVLDEA